MGWTDEQIEELKALWGEGLTTGDIGKRLGVSKNAVVGKAHRLGLQGRPSPIKRGQEQAIEVPDPKPPRKRQSKKPQTTVDLSAHTCRWPIGDPRDSDFHFCGEPSVSGKPYCAQHVSVAYVNARSPAFRDDSTA